MFGACLDQPRHWGREEAIILVLIVAGENAASDAFLVELTTQCLLAGYAYERLREQARCEIERDFTSRKPRPDSAIELLADCTVFLSAAGVIAKTLFPNEKKKRTTSVIRGERLRALLELRDLPTLRSLVVRNSFEHIDKELDRFLENPPVKFVQYHLTRHTPPDGVVLKRFDPRSLSISYLKKRLDLRACYTEIKLVEERVSKANARVRMSGGLLGEDTIT